ncbi:uncharacterized protein N7483_000609 [Penicillium malachiteum]|uniref:uncharacterized protein n=1 Tax=Penicillium malachiteum TaxID=1324776 RepID=UPI00254686DE|nr:uncharacterized protein N7483_000609 [Penicillium malachiteum]KAJ5735484.1 hypothetical protein N7483_000609 [Penicillium malachiteum]
MSSKAARKAAKKAQAASEFYEGLEDIPELEPVYDTFRFLDLPSEIRVIVYHFVLFTPTKKTARQNAGTVGASAKKAKLVAPTAHRIALFLVSHRIHGEASHYFYSTQIFRVFTIQDFSRRPTLRAIPRRYRPLVSTLELILGNSWTAPPKSWVVDKGLGLPDMTLTRTLKLFIECDPSQPIFEGFRISKEYYTEFSGRLVKEILDQLPDLEWVEFDAYPSVQKNGSLMSRLLREARAANKKVKWGPQRGWTDINDIGFVVDEPEPVGPDVNGVQSHVPTPVDELANMVESITLNVSDRAATYN